MKARHLLLLAIVAGAVHVALDYGLAKGAAAAGIGLLVASIWIGMADN